MTEQDYEKLMSEEAKGQGKVFAERYPTMNGRKPHREDVLAHVFSIGHKAGVAFARANPAPEVLELVEALEELIDICDDREARKEIDSFTSQPARQAITRFKERGRG